MSTIFISEIIKNGSEMQLSSGDLFSGFNNFGPLLRQKSDSSSSIRSRMSEVGIRYILQCLPPLTSQQLTRIENATNRIVNNARTLDAEIETQWAKHKGPRRWALMEKVFEHVQIKGEESSHAAYALKKHLEACTDQDFEEMGKTRQEAEQAFQLLETLTPLATYPAHAERGQEGHFAAPGSAPRGDSGSSSASTPPSKVASGAGSGAAASGASRAASGAGKASSGGEANAVTQASKIATTNKSPSSEGGHKVEKRKRNFG
ncbi:hypothetical protein EV426DRAFT_643410 [Tirmania nivea]|nr:hypothetical protein EV426DRAFT_643410 [Tirmania nivea]